MKSRYHLAEHREEYTASGLCSSASLRGAVSFINDLTGDSHLTGSAHVVPDFLVKYKFPKKK